jgi:hypothetical protein
MDDRTDRTEGDYKPEEIERRRDDAVRRALNTPPQPHKTPLSGKTDSKVSRPQPTKRTVGEGRARVGKAQ